MGQKLDIDMVYETYLHLFEEQTDCNLLSKIQTNTYMLSKNTCICIRLLVNLNLSSSK